MKGQITDKGKYLQYLRLIMAIRRQPNKKWTEDFNRHIMKKDTNDQQSSTSFAIREMKIQNYSEMPL